MQFQFYRVLSFRRRRNLRDCDIHSDQVFEMPSYLTAGQAVPRHDNTPNDTISNLDSNQKTL